MKYRFASPYPYHACHVEAPQFHISKRACERSAYCNHTHPWHEVIPFRKALVSAYRCKVYAILRTEQLDAIIASGRFDFIFSDDADDARRFRGLFSDGAAEARRFRYLKEHDRLCEAYDAAARAGDTDERNRLALEIEALTRSWIQHGYARSWMKCNDFSWIDRLGPLPDDGD